MIKTKNFNELTISEQCALIGRVAKLYDDGNSVRKIADELDESYELIHDVLGFILIAREPENYN